MTAHPAMSFARELIASLVHLGVQDVVVCPGSRSGPLAHAIAEASAGEAPLDVPQVRAHVRIDERSAGFLAVGLARAAVLGGRARPVAVVTTSGTAVGNLLPAVMEAHHAGLALILLTADRPGELRGVGANQTTDQVGIFSTFVRWSAAVAAPAADEHPGRAQRLAVKAVELSLGKPSHGNELGSAGPVHLDVEFRAPLHNDGGMWPHVAGLPDVESLVVVHEDADDRPLPHVTQGVVIAGDGAGAEAHSVAAAHGWPLFAEPTSGARCGTHAIANHVNLLASPVGIDLVAEVHQVVVIGRPTLDRHTAALIDKAPALFVAAHGARWREAPRHAQRIVPQVPRSWTAAPAEVDATWWRRWSEAGQRLKPRSDGWSSLQAASVVVEALTGNDVVLLGSSGVIRAVNHVAPVWEESAQPRMVANRGLSGIDGTVSTAVGLALGLGQSGGDGPRITALMGDLTFLHDVGGLLIGPLEPRPHLRIVVVNDGGGTIFSAMEHATGDPSHLERFFTTPHGVDISAVCAAYGVRHHQVNSGSALKSALKRPVDELTVIEAVIT